MQCNSNISGFWPIRQPFYIRVYYAGEGCFVYYNDDLKSVHHDFLDYDHRWKPATPRTKMYEPEDINDILKMIIYTFILGVQKHQRTGSVIRNHQHITMIEFVDRNHNAIPQSWSLRSMCILIRDYLNMGLTTHMLDCPNDSIDVLSGLSENFYHNSKSCPDKTRGAIAGTLALFEFARRNKSDIFWFLKKRHWDKNDILATKLYYILSEQTYAIEQLDGWLVATPPENKSMLDLMGQGYEVYPYTQYPIDDLNDLIDWLGVTETVQEMQARNVSS